MNTVKLAALLGLISMNLLRAASGDIPPLPTDNPQSIALDQACQNDDLNQVKTLLSQGAPIDGHITQYAFPPLTTAAGSGNLDVLKYLIDRHANLDLGDSQGSTPLLHACWMDQADCALALIEAGANVNQGSSAGRTPLMYAATHGNDRIVAALIAHKVDLDANSNEGPALDWATKLSTVKLLCDAGANPNLLPTGRGAQQYSPLGFAIDRHDLDLIHYLLGQNGTDANSGPAAASLLPANIDLKDNKGLTALMLASEFDQLDVVRLLVGAKANLDLVDAKGETALTLAGDRGNGDVVDFLVGSGARRTDVHIIDRGKPDPPLLPSQSWALAVGAIYTQTNGLNAEVLGGGDTSSRNDVKSRLKDTWNVTSKVTFLKEIDDLSTSGHRSLYQREGAQMAALSDGEFIDKLVAMTPEQASQAKAMRASYIKWKGKSGLSWDLCRCAYLINEGYNAKYIDEDQAWQLLLYNARLLQAGFGSWQEMSDNFLDGREIWAHQRDPRYEMCSRLLLNAKDQNSPWNEYPWQTDLSAK